MPGGAQGKPRQPPGPLRAALTQSPCAARLLPPHGHRGNRRDRVWWRNRSRAWRRLWLRAPRCASRHGAGRWCRGWCLLAPTPHGGHSPGPGAIDTEYWGGSKGSLSPSSALSDCGHRAWVNTKAWPKSVFKALEAAVPSRAPSCCHCPAAGAPSVLLGIAGAWGI